MLLQQLNRQSGRHKVRSINRKTDQDDHIDTEGSWAISYGDMITLLLSFFVLYFTVDHNKTRANKMQDTLMVRLKENGVKSNIEDVLKIQLNIGQVPGEFVDSEIINKYGARVYRDEKQLIVDFDDISFFEIGNTDVNTRGRNALDNFVKIYMPFAGPHKVRVQAYTDTRKVKSTNLRYRDNLELSALRSVAAMRVLQASGLPLSKMKLAGYGEISETQEKLMKIQNEKDPLKYSRKVVLIIEPVKEGN